MEEPASENKPTQTPTASGSGDNDKLFGILAYLGILFLVPLLAAKDSKFAQYHANQGVVLFIADIAVWVVLFIVGLIAPLSWGLHEWTLLGGFINNVDKFDPLFFKISPLGF